MDTHEAQQWLQSVFQSSLDNYNTVHVITVQAYTNRIKSINYLTLSAPGNSTSGIAYLYHILLPVHHCGLQLV